MVLSSNHHVELYQAVAPGGLKRAFLSSVRHDYIHLEVQFEHQVLGSTNIWSCSSSHTTASPPQWSLFENITSLNGEILYPYWKRWHTVGAMFDNSSDCLRSRTSNVVFEVLPSTTGGQYHQPIPIRRFSPKALQVGFKSVGGCDL